MVAASGEREMPKNVQVNEIEASFELAKSKGYLWRVSIDWCEVHGGLDKYNCY